MITINNIAPCEAEGISYTTNEYGELVIVGTYNKIPVKQTLPVHPPCILYFDTKTSNFQAVKLDDIPDTFQIVQYITSIK